MTATYGFVSFTEVEVGAHQSYNAWHLFDHLPEQLPLPGIVWGQRWVLTPELRAHATASPPLDRVHYVTLYLLAEPIEQTLADFFALAAALRVAGRFHLQRVAHLSGVLTLESMTSADPTMISAEAVPYRPHRGVHVRLEAATAPHRPRAVTGTGEWTFTTHPLSPPALHGLRATWTWLAEEPTEVASVVATTDHSVMFDATLAVVDPAGPWDWFD